MSEGDVPFFLSLKQVMVLHRRSLAEHGGVDGLRDPGAVESALASAKNTWLYAGGDTFDIAAAYAFHIAEAHAFWMETSAPPSRVPSRFLRRITA